MAGPDRLYFTEDDEANALIATDPFALLVGFALDQQITVQQAFLGPLRIKQRMGTLDSKTVQKTQPEPRRPPVPWLDGPPSTGSRLVRRRGVRRRSRSDLDRREQRRRPTRAAR